VNTDTETRWMTMAEAIAESGLSHDTIRNYIRAGTLNAERIGPRLIRIDASSFAALRVNITGT
jgi:excisionase family DNA binding protein